MFAISKPAQTPYKTGSILLRPPLYLKPHHCTNTHAYDKTYLPKFLRVSQPYAAKTPTYYYRTCLKHVVVCFTLPCFAMQLHCWSCFTALQRRVHHTWQVSSHCMITYCVRLYPTHVPNHISRLNRPFHRYCYRPPFITCMLIACIIIILYTFPCLY